MKAWRWEINRPGRVTGNAIELKRQVTGGGYIKLKRHEGRGGLGRDYKIISRRIGLNGSSEKGGRKRNSGVGDGTPGYQIEDGALYTDRG
jgi:hypothetical protein